MVGRMHSLLNHTLHAFPGVGGGGQGGIFVASILNMPDKFQPCVKAFNKELPGIISAYSKYNVSSFWVLCVVVICWLLRGAGTSALVT
jgi:hypothetical protein